MTVGAAILRAASVLTGERLAVPHDVGTWAAIGYASLAGSVAVFSLFVYVVRRWTASSASNVMLLMPLVTIAGASLITGEAITVPFVAGGGAGACRGLRGRDPAAIRGAGDPNPAR
jgi:drug/metabolite transporter (DMT)-like permease